VVLQLDALPVIPQVIVPAGAVAPVIPVTVAVYVIVPPSTGLAGEEATEIVGVAGATTIDSGEVGGNPAYTRSPL
jgi:hypothetical protein